MNLHLFNPENDLALARDLANYTAPPAAVALARAGAVLPLWYGEPGDALVCDGLNAGWLRRMTGTFGLRTRLWDHSTEGFTPAPWGWSKAVRSRFKNLGFGPGTMPSDEILDRLRLLSSRRSACILGADLARAGLMRPAFVPREISSLPQAKEYCREYPDALFKLPWSSSGRGQIRVNSEAGFDARATAIEGALRRYGFLTAEPFHRDKALDLALLFTARTSGAVIPAGISLFRTLPNGDYAGNILASDEDLLRSIDSRFGIAGTLGAISHRLCESLGALLGGDYSGPLGVDMMVLRSGETVPCVELNLRMTMGHVARRFHDRFCAQDSTGLFSISSLKPDAPGEPEISGGRLVRGDLRLNPPGPAIAFTASVDTSKIVLF